MCRASGSDRSKYARRCEYYALFAMLSVSPLTPSSGLLSLLQRSDGLGHVLAVAGGIHLLEHTRDPARGIDHERRPRDAHPLVPERVLLDPHAVRGRDRMVLIDDKGHRQTILLLEV